MLTLLIAWTIRQHLAGWLSRKSAVGGTNGQPLFDSLKTFPVISWVFIFTNYY